MPDIAMCSNAAMCPLLETCRRSEYSGTEPDPHRQAWSWFNFTTDEQGKAECDHYWPTIRKDTPDA